MPKKGKPYEMTDEMKDIVTGNILRDGSLTSYESKKKKTARFTHAQTAEDPDFKAYNNFVFEKFKPICLADEPAVREVIFESKPFYQSVFNTSYYQELYTNFFTKFYIPNPDYEDLQRQGKTKIPKSIRIIPREFLKENLNERAFTFWYMDDGSGSAGEKNKETRINTQSFSFSDVVFLCRLITQKFNLYCWPVPRRKDKTATKYQYQIYISSYSRNQLIECTKDYFYPPLRKKLLSKGVGSDVNFELELGTFGTGRFKRSITQNPNNTFTVTETCFSDDNSKIITEKISFELNSLDSREYFKKYRELEI